MLDNGFKIHYVYMIFFCIFIALSHVRFLIKIFQNPPPNKVSEKWSKEGWIPIMSITNLQIMCTLDKRSLFFFNMLTIHISIITGKNVKFCTRDRFEIACRSNKIFLRNSFFIYNNMGYLNKQIKKNATQTLFIS